MSFKISNGVKCLTALVLVSACSSTSSGSGGSGGGSGSGGSGGGSGIVSFDTSTIPTPVVRSSGETTTGTFSSNDVTAAQFDDTTDTLTVTRADGTDVVMTGEVESNGAISGYTVGGSATTPMDGAAIVAQTSGGAGYAVALYDNELSADPSISVIVGGDGSTAPAQSAIKGATFSGQYVGFARITDKDAGRFTEGNVTGDASLTVNADGDGFEAGDIITNRQTLVGSVANVTTTGGAIDGDSMFAGGVSTTDLFGQTNADGAVIGGFFDASSSNAMGEAAGAITMTGGTNCANGNIRAPGSICVIETGTFVAAPE